VTVLPDATVPAETDTVDRLVETGLGVTAMVGRGVEVTAAPPIVACTVVAVPAAPAVKVAVYVPSELSVVAPTVPVLVPPLTVKTTARPPVVMSVPLASLAWSVRVTVPPKATVPAETETVDSLVETLGRSGC